MPSLPTTEQTLHSWLALRPAVTGFAVVDRHGATGHAHGAAVEPYPEQMSDLCQAAQGIGLELGFENLCEVHLPIKGARSVSIARPDHSLVHILVSPQANTHELARQLREREKL